MIYNDQQADIDMHMSDSNIGARKGKQVKDHLFIVHGIIHSVIEEKDSSVDIQIYDLEQAFDSLWLEDCMIDLYDSLSAVNRNDKLALLYESCINNYVAVNTPHGLTERKHMKSLVQQGGTWGPLMCSNSVDTIGKSVWNSHEPCYKYKNCVRILPLAMVDDILAVCRCGIESLSMNTLINSRIELKKLKFHTPDKAGRSKCHKIHIGAEDRGCPQLKVHGSEMKDVPFDEYLGDTICANGKNRKNVQKRLGRGFGIISEIMNILHQLSYGHHYFEIALLLRNSLFLSSILNNVEVMYNLNKSDIEEFDKLDLILLRKILDAPISTPKEAFYLELGILPPSAHFKIRRVNYLHYLLLKPREEMISRFLWAQIRNPIKGDWICTVRSDLKDFGMSNELEDISRTSKQVFNRHVKKQALNATFCNLLERKALHSKMKNLEYSSFELRSYFKLTGFTAPEMRKIFLFRVGMSKFWGNFRGNEASRLCALCHSHPDLQEFLSNCYVIKSQFKDSKQTISGIYREVVTDEDARSLVKILEYREEHGE